MMGEVITELHNIQKTSIQDDLFKIPPEYREMPSQQMLPMPGQNQ
jgi:hypothetical protein